MICQVICDVEEHFLLFISNSVQSRSNVVNHGRTYRFFKRTYSVGTNILGSTESFLRCTSHLKNPRRVRQI